METVASGKRIRQCPNCSVKLTRYEWSKLWWMSGMMSGRLVQPCSECGARLRMSSMALVSSTAAVGLIVTAVLYIVYDYPRVMLFVALALLLVILIAMLATRIESLPSASAPLDPPPERVGKKRL